MDPAVAQIIVTSITVCVPALVTILTTKSVKAQNNKHNTRSNIMQLIMEDKLAVMVEHKLPENYQAIHEEYDEYIASGGNSWVHKKVEEYDKMIANYEKKLLRNDIIKKEEGCNPYYINSH